MTVSGRVPEGPNASGLIPLAGARGKLAAVFIPASWRWVSRPSSWSGIGTASLVAHLRCQAANAVFIEQVSQRTNGEMQQFGGVGLVSGSAPERFQNVGLFELVQVGSEINAVVRKGHRLCDAVGVVVVDLLGQSF